MDPLCRYCERRYTENVDCAIAECPILSLRKPFEPDPHFTFSDDPEEVERPGWGFLKFDKIWWDTKLDNFVKWHDRVTSKGSIAQRIGITVEQINETQANLLKNKGTWGFIVNNVLAPIQRFFYEGPIRTLNPFNKKD